MSGNDKFEEQKFKPGQSGNPKGKPKGLQGGRMQALGALDRIIAKEENLLLIEDALEEELRKRPLWFFTNIVMPLLPKETKGVLEGGDRVIEWRSLVAVGSPPPAAGEGGDAD